MKVKLFWKLEPKGSRAQFEPARDLEAEINNWLSENPRIKVVDLKQSASGGSLGASLWFISVWYEEGIA